MVWAFLVAIAFSVWAFIAVVFGRSAPKRLRFAYLLVFAPVGIVAFLTTFRYEYFSNENTRICGWPVPVVIFQREGPESRWDDFVGPMTVFGYPVNLAIFMFFPSALFLGLVYWQYQNANRTGGEPIRGLPIEGVEEPD